MLSRIKIILGLNKKVDKIELSTPIQLLPPTPEVKPQVKEFNQEVYERNKKLHDAIRKDMAGGFRD